MSFFTKQKKTGVDWTFIYLATILLIIVVAAFISIRNSAVICTNTEAALKHFFHRATAQEYALEFEQKYGEDYICVYEQQNRTLICKYPIYDRTLQ